MKKKDNLKKFFFKDPVSLLGVKFSACCVWKGEWREVVSFFPFVTVAVLVNTLRLRVNVSDGRLQAAYQCQNLEPEPKTLKAKKTARERILRTCAGK